MRKSIFVLPIVSIGKYMLISTILVLLLAQLPAFADEVKSGEKKVYVREGEDGATEFSDIPGKDATVIKVPKAQTYKAPVYKKIQPRSTTKSKTKKQSDLYKFAISAPQADSTIRENAGNVTVSVSLTPKLNPDHYVVYKLDGKKSKPIKASSYTFKSVSRGEHTASASITSRTGSEIQSAANVSFNVLRYSSLQPKPAPLPPSTPPPKANP